MTGEINQRLCNIDAEEMARLTRQTRQILLRSYLRRHIPVPAWVVRPEGRYVGIQGGATAVQAVGVIGPIALAAGDVVRVSGAIADCASATIAGAYLGMELVE